MITFIDVQHAGKRGRRIRDRGAWGDWSGDGQTDYLELEAAQTLLLGAKLMQRIWELGPDYSAIMLTDGWYSERHKRCNEYAGSDLCVYLALHFNALRGPRVTRRSGRYASVFFDHRSAASRGPRVAGSICVELERNLPEISEAKSIPARSDNWTKRAYSTISGLGGRIVGLCIEAAFIDQRDHLPIFDPSGEGLDRIARSVVDGIVKWRNSN